MFLRPCFLVVDYEFAGSISSRKLIIETAKFNVITAYSYAEAEATLDRYPRVDGCVVNASADSAEQRFLRVVRERHPSVKLILTGETNEPGVPVDLHVPSYSPDALLRGLRELFPADAKQAEAIERKLEEHLPPAR